MTIKHLVIPGGGPTGLKALGALQYLESNGFWNINNIETIYATSAGSIISVLLCLKFDWETINDYIVKRPWTDAYQITIHQIFEAYSKKGLFDKNIADIFYKPFFDAKDISMDITLLEFFELTNIEIHLFTLEMNHFQLEDLSYKTHPDLALLTAVQMSSAIPILISPVCIDDKCYVDGGVVCNYPVNQCILRAENVEEIFGLRNEYKVNDTTSVKSESTILEYVMNFISKLVNNVKLAESEKPIPNELIYEVDYMNYSNIQSALTSKEVRQSLIDNGVEAGKKFLLSVKQVDSVK
uniref:PNPLA domain-containing protein n=1 Tax=viral metagenome TaxID=1070528 RepID=A0A6C0AZP1_9ZZZZ